MTAARRALRAPRASARTAALALAGWVLLAGCSERQLVARPDSRPGTGTWVLVWLAGALAAVLVGVLLTLPAWRRRRGSRFATGVLALQTGATAVSSGVLIGLAVRSWQLIERPLDDPAVALVRISRVDGDTALFSLAVLVTVVLGGFLVTLLALATRLAASDDPIERWVACGVLGVEVGAAATLTVLVLLGFRGWPYRIGLVALPVVVAALVACWPRPRRPRRLQGTWRPSSQPGPSP